SLLSFRFFFFFQAEDGIRDFHVTGVQTCALPIWTHVEPVLALLEAIAQANARASAGAGVVEAQVSAFVGETPGQLSMAEAQALRSEERRVGKECRSRWSADR